MSKSDASTRPPLWKVWWIACRPHTLTASLAPVVVSYHVGVSKFTNLDYAAYLVLTLKWAAFCMLMQLGTNLHNDYADFVKGADTDKRVGQARATQKGWLTPFQTAIAASGVLMLGFVLGLDFMLGMDPNTGRRPYLVFIVATSIFNAFAYTGGPWPLGYIGLGDFSIGYSGLGDLFVFLYFGLVATLTLPFLYASRSESSSEQDLQGLLLSYAPYAVQVAALATNIIVVNNLRDRHTDVGANKRTLAVRFGATFCRVEFVSMLVLAYLLVVYDFWVNDRNLIRLLPLATVVLAVKEIRAIFTKEGPLLNPHVGGSAKVQFLFCLLLSLACRMG